MNSKLIMISINYDHSKKPNEFGFLEVKKINIGSEIQYKKENEWVVTNHYREFKNDRLKQIALRLDESTLPTDNVIIHELNAKEGIRLVLDKRTNLWYQPAKFESTKKDKYYRYSRDNTTIGIMSAGTVAVSIVRNNQIIDKLVINFVPSGLKMKDYEEMIIDLYRIREELVKDEKNLAEIAIRQKKTFLSLEQQVKNLSKAINNICMQPHKTLKLVSRNKKKKINGRFDIRAEIEEYSSPGKPTYRQRSIEETTTTYENGLIKQQLIDLRNYVQQQIKLGTINQIENEQKYLFENSDSYLKNLIGKIENLRNEQRLIAYTDKLQKKLNEYSIFENNIRQHIYKVADYSITNSVIQDHKYVELEVECLETPNFKHQQSKNGITLNFSYDNRDSNFKTISYKFRNNNNELVSRRFNSYFGSISLESTHVHSHSLIYEAFHHNLLLRNSVSKIVIRGYVRPVMNGIDPVSYINPNNENYNNYEFQFSRITEIIVNEIPVSVPVSRPDLQEFLNTKIPVKIEELKVADGIEESEMQLSQLYTLTRLEKKKKHLDYQLQGYKRLEKIINDCLNVSIFTNINSNHRLKSNLTPLFLHDPNYHSAWTAIKAIDYEISASLFARGYNHLVKTAKVEQIYEVWVLYKILEIITKELGWEIKSKSLVDQLDYYLLKGKLLKGFSTVLTNGEWDIEFYYEPKINLKNGNYITPDFVFRYIYKNIPTGLVILDAKYRDYSIQGINKWKSDIQDVAIEKYGQMQPVEEMWRLPILHSGIVHCDANFSSDSISKINPYHVFYNKEIFNKELSTETAHKYGSIYLLPSQTHIFKNWFRMIMEYPIKSYQTCWCCGEEVNISKRQLMTSGGHPKYHFTCKNCNEFWVKVHCRENRKHLIIKHTLNYHLQVSHSHKWYVVCPCCGNGR